jgi:hypothetical protein
MLLMRIVWSFVRRKFSSVGKGEWWDEMKYGQKLKLEDAHVTPRNIQEVQASKLGDAQGTPFFINKNIKSSFKTLYFYYFICYVLFLEPLYFCFQFSFVLFSVVYCWIPACLFWRETRSIFIARNTLVLTLIVLRVFTFC